IFTNLYIPEGNPKQVEWFNELQRVSTSPANAAKLQRVLSRIDVRELLPKVTTPTLILHAKDDQVVPFLAGEEMSRRIPSAKFVPLEGENHILLESEPAWQAFSKVTREFLNDEAGDLSPANVAAPKPEEDAIDQFASADGTRI